MKLKVTFLLFFAAVEILSAQESKPEFDTRKAQYLYHFAYECIDQEYPNKLGQVLSDDSYLRFTGIGL